MRVRTRCVKVWNGSKTQTGRPMGDPSDREDVGT